MIGAWEASSRFGTRQHTEKAGLTRLPTRSRQPCETEFLVEPGSLHCLAPASRLRRAEVAPEGRQVYEPANGEPVEYRYGFARIAFPGDETVAHVIFGPENAEPILGVVALENTGAIVDPATQTPKRLPALPLK